MIAKTLCLIPAKGESTRCPRKNLMELGGHPLVAHSIRKGILSKVFTKTCVSTESEEIAKIAQHYGGDVPFLRPARLSKDPATIADVALHALDHYEAKGEVFERVCILLPTTPFVTMSELRDAQSLYSESNADVLLSVTRTEFPPYNAWQIEKISEEKRLVPCFPDSPFRHTKSTECPESYRSNGAVTIADVVALRKFGTFYHSAPLPFVMPQEHSVDIDTMFEFLLAKALWETRTVQMDGGLFK